MDEAIDSDFYNLDSDLIASGGSEFLRFATLVVQLRLVCRRKRKRCRHTMT